MFDNTLFENWLDEQATRTMQKVTQGEALSSNEMMILVLKAQTNHIAHLEQDLRGEMVALRQDMDKRFEQVDKRFEQVNKRFEQVDKHFEQMEKRFDVLTMRMDSFMRWSFTTTLTVGGLVIGVLKFWPPAG